MKSFADWTQEIGENNRKVVYDLTEEFSNIITDDDIGYYCTSVVPDMWPVFNSEEDGA